MAFSTPTSRIDFDAFFVPPSKKRICDKGARMFDFPIVRGLERGMFQNNEILNMTDQQQINSKQANYIIRNISLLALQLCCAFK